MMLKLLRENEIAPKFRSLRSAETGSVVAVPFWGVGAAEELGLNDGRNGRILCNLASTGCNPYAVEAVCNLPAIKVASHPRLHAKIYATRGSAIVGSSNASANGLMIDGKPDGWIEANVLSDDPHFVSSVHKLFEEIWDDPTTKIVDAVMLASAKKAWDSRPRIRFPFKAKTLLAACRERPEDFGNVYVVAYTSGLGEEGARAFSRFKMGASLTEETADEALSIQDFQKAWGYQVEGIKEGAWLIDFDCRNLAKARVHGCARATGVQINCDSETPLTIARRGVIQIAGTPNRLTIAAEEKALFAANAKRIVQASNDRMLTLAEVLQVIEGKKLASPS